MSANQAGAGTLAAAVLGVGTTATAAHQPSAKVAASQIVHELARTGTNLTVEIAVLAMLLLLAGVLLVTLSRRHASPRKTPFGLDPPQLA